MAASHNMSPHLRKSFAALPMGSTLQVPQLSKTVFTRSVGPKGMHGIEVWLRCPEAACRPGKCKSSWNGRDVGSSMSVGASLKYAHFIWGTRIPDSQGSVGTPKTDPNLDHVTGRVRLRDPCRARQNQGHSTEFESKLECGSQKA